MTTIDERRYERMEEALRNIREWCDAYPLDQFPEVDLYAIREALGDGPYSRLHASWARHILSGIRKHLDTVDSVEPKEKPIP